MGEFLVERFLEEINIRNYQEYIAKYGVVSLLQNFELWLINNDLLDNDKVANFITKKNKVKEN